MTYRNTVTGEVINVKSVITGGNWELLDEVPKEEPVKKTTTRKKKVTKDE